MYILLEMLKLNIMVKSVPVKKKRRRKKEEEEEEGRRRRKEEEELRLVDT